MMKLGAQTEFIIWFLDFFKAPVHDETWGTEFNIDLADGSQTWQTAARPGKRQPDLANGSRT